jgi:8-amino-7-oxononanoate synthase
MSFQETLQQYLQEDSALQRTRQLKIFSPEMIRFCDNDYLGLASHPALKTAALRSLEENSSLGARAARLISGHCAAHQALEQELATFKQSEAALVFPTGYAAALGAITTVLGADDVIILDKLAHACLIDGAKLSGAKMRVFSHNDLSQLEDILTETRRHSTTTRILIVVESLYSMDGDLAPLPELVHLKETYGAWLMVDEAHATGILGSQGRGLCYHHRLSNHIDIQMGTLSKALGVSGGFIAGSQDLIQLLLNRARSFLFTTAQPTALAAAALASLKLIQSEEGEARRTSLFHNISLLNDLWETAPTVSPIFPVVLGSESQALELSRQLEEKGFLIPAIRYPTVAKGKARLRISLSSEHHPTQITNMARLVQDLLSTTSRSNGHH